MLTHTQLETHTDPWTVGSALVTKKTQIVNASVLKISLKPKSYFKYFFAVTF